MSVTRLTVFIGIICSVWMTSPLTASALEEFVGLLDRGSTKVKTCVENVDDVDRKGGRSSFSNNTYDGVELIIGLDGDGIVDDVSAGGDLFDASFFYDGASPVALFDGAWSKIDERKNGRKTYQLTPGGDLTDDTASGWKNLLTLISNEAGDACFTAPPAYYRGLSDLVKGTLIVENKPPRCASSENIRDIDCVNACGAGASSTCKDARVNLDVKSFMNNGGTDDWAWVKYDWVRFRYTARGYVIETAPVP